MSAELLIVVMAQNGAFQVFRNEGGAPVDVSDEFVIDVEAESFTVRRKPAEVPADG